eukprot:4187576-Prymnesium_polylepis.1
MHPVPAAVLAVLAQLDRLIGPQHHRRVLSRNARVREGMRQPGRVLGAVGLRPTDVGDAAPVALDEREVLAATGATQHCVTVGKTKAKQASPRGLLGFQDSTARPPRLS